MQYQLRQILVFLDAHPVNRPEIMLGKSSTAFDAEGALTNDVTTSLVSQLLVNLAEHSRRFTDQLNAKNPPR